MSIQHAAGQTADQASWLIGEGLFKPGINAKALRSMLEPGTAYDDPQLGKDPQVGSMADYVDTTEDNGGVHLNSGIPNRAFALAARSVGGHSWEQTGKVWYGALTSSAVGASTDFRGFADATVAAATQLFAGTAVPDQVRAAWVEVGVLDGSVPVDVVEPAPAPAGGPEQESPYEGSSGGAAPAASGRAAPAASGRAALAGEAPADEAPEKVAVRRSGGFAGQVRSAQIELGTDPQGEEVRRLLRRVDLQQVTTSESLPDRFVYTVEIGEQSVTVGERDLTPDLQRVVQIVLGSSGPDRPGPADRPRLISSAGDVGTAARSPTSTAMASHHTHDHQHQDDDHQDADDGADQSSVHSRLPTEVVDLSRKPIGWIKGLAITATSRFGLVRGGSQAVHPSSRSPSVSAPNQTSTAITGRSSTRKGRRRNQRTPTTTSSHPDDHQSDHRPQGSHQPGGDVEDPDHRHRGHGQTGRDVAGQSRTLGGHGRMIAPAAAAVSGGRPRPPRSGTARGSRGWEPDPRQG